MFQFFSKIDLIKRNHVHLLHLLSDANTENCETVELLRDRMQDSLLEYARARGANYHRRVGNLLLCLPILMQQKILAKEYWFNVKKGGRVPLHKLLSEMLDYAVSS